jgi:outer membrane protein assembly factor BamB
MIARRLFALVVGFGFVVLALAADWPQWRGPKRDGASPETGLLKQWPAEGPKLVWRIDNVGDGYGTPAVVGDRIYLISNTGLDNEFVQALDAKDGKQLWATKLGKVSNKNQFPPYPAARSTPTIDGERLYALSSDGDLACLETANGKVVWKKKLPADFGGVAHTWAYAESPLIDGEMLVCTPGGAEATLLALNKSSGEIIWKAPVPGGDAAGYASVVATEAAGIKQYVAFLAKGVVGVDAKTGKFLWRYDRTAKGSPANIATPVTADGLVYTAGVRVGGGTVKIRAEGDKIAADEVYFERGLPTAIGGALLVDGYLYGTGNDGLVCVEFATGKVKWKDKSVGAASLLYADGMLILHGEKNDMALVEATPEGYREKGRFSLPSPPKHNPRPGPPEVAWSYPALANGKLYVRDLNVMWCYDVKGQ